MEAKDTLLSKEEKLGCSLVGKYPFKDVEDVIRETCIHQAGITWDIALKGKEAEIEQARGDGFTKGIIEYRVNICPVRIEQAKREERKRAHFREVVLLTIISDMYSPQVRGKIELALQAKMTEDEQALKEGAK